MLTYPISVDLTNEQLKTLDEVEGDNHFNMKRLQFVIQELEYSFDEAIGLFDFHIELYENCTMLDVAKLRAEWHLEYDDMVIVDDTEYYNLSTIDYEKYASELWNDGGFWRIENDIFYSDELFYKNV
ncbi:MAG: hypothetical protein Q8T08_15635 [Ignavibacteria bacterium]|nr:hypothetical protein [Ignavibacteria bacterium]